MPIAEWFATALNSIQHGLRTFDHTGLRILTGYRGFAGASTPACACVRARFFPSPLGEGYLYIYNSVPVDYVRHCVSTGVPKEPHLYDVMDLVFPELREARDLKENSPGQHEPESVPYRVAHKTRPVARPSDRTESRADSGVDTRWGMS